MLNLREFSAILGIFCTCLIGFCLAFRVDAFLKGINHIEKESKSLLKIFDYQLRFV